MLDMMVMMMKMAMMIAHHTVGHNGDDDDPFKGRPRDKPDKESPEEKVLLACA